nr:MAG TPA: hypothetical protein [Caudoviricetes sp.]
MLKTLVVSGRNPPRKKRLFLWPSVRLIQDL